MKNHLMIANTVLAAQALAGACVISCAVISSEAGQWIDPIFVRSHKKPDKAISNSEPPYSCETAGRYFY